MAEQCGSQHRRTTYVAVGVRAPVGVCRLAKSRGVRTVCRSVHEGGIGRRRACVARRRRRRSSPTGVCRPANREALRQRIECRSAHGSRQQHTAQRRVSPWGEHARSGAAWLGGIEKNGSGSRGRDGEGRVSRKGERVTTRAAMASRTELQVPTEHDVKIRGRLLGIILIRWI